MKTNYDRRENIDGYTILFWKYDDGEWFWKSEELGSNPSGPWSSLAEARNDAIACSREGGGNRPDEADSPVSLLRERAYNEGVDEPDEMLNDGPGKMLNAMLLLATDRFGGVYDKGGKPYILHCLKVMHYLKTEDEELQCIALGHDLVEDTKTTYAELRSLGFTERVIEGIRALTKVPGETNEEYLEKVKENPDAVLVKLQDLRHNSDIRRLKGVEEKDIRRMQKYHKMYLELKQHV